MIEVIYTLYHKPLRFIALVAIGGLAMLLAVSPPVNAQTPLTVEQVRAKAVEFNRQYLQAQEDVDIAGARVSQAWGDALPNINLNSSYDRSFKVPKVFFVMNNETVELQTGFKNSFGTTVSLEQPIWHGGKVFTALSAAKLYRRYSTSIAAAVEDLVVFNAEQLFYAAILARAQLDVQEKALESNTANLDVVQKKYDQGMVSEYELLRARVEQQNVQPAIIQAQSEVDLSQKRLKSFIGLNLKDSVVLVGGETDTSLAGLPSLNALIDTALARRPEMQAADQLRQLSKKAITVAKAEYWPHLDAVGAYSWAAQSDDFTLTKNNSSSWTAGLRLNFSLFPFTRKKGGVNEARAQYNQATLAEDQSRDDITLEVEAAYTKLLQAKKSLDIQGATIAAAEEGLKIAQVRYEAAVGTQLEVLSAQTALTQAREVEAQALYSFRVAKAELKKVTKFAL